MVLDDISCAVLIPETIHLSFLAGICPCHRLVGRETIPAYIWPKAEKYSGQVAGLSQRYLLYVAGY